MTDTESADERNDDPGREPLGGDEDQFTDESDQQEDVAGIDQVPSDPATGYDATDQNAPLPDWGPTDGTHGVDGSDL